MMQKKGFFNDSSNKDFIIWLTISKFLDDLNKTLKKHKHELF